MGRSRVFTPRYISDLKAASELLRAAAIVEKVMKDMRHTDRPAKARKKGELVLKHLKESATCLIEEERND